MEIFNARRNPVNFSYAWKTIKFNWIIIAWYFYLYRRMWAWYDDVLWRTYFHNSSLSCTKNFRKKNFRFIFICRWGNDILYFNLYAYNLQGKNIDSWSWGINIFIIFKRHWRIFSRRECWFNVIKYIKNKKNLWRMKVLI